MNSNIIDSKRETQTFFKEFIKKYELQAQLWDPNHEHYKNKYKRNDGYEELLNIMRKYDPSATRYHVRQKVNSLRSNYRKELRRYLTSKKVLSNGDEVYEYRPTGWKFYALRFLNSVILNEDDGDDPPFEIVVEDSAFNESKFDYNVSTDEQETDTIEPAAEDTYNSNDNFDRTDYVTEPDNSNEIKIPLKTNRKRKYVKLYDDRNQSISNQVTNKEFEAIGANVALKLKRMDENQRYHAELLINKVLINGLKNNLSDETDLTDLQVLDVKTFQDE